MGMDDIKNAGDELAGKAKEAAGKMTGNEDLEAEGRAQDDLADVRQAADDRAEDAQWSTEDDAADLGSARVDAGSTGEGMRDLSQEPVERG